MTRRIDVQLAYVNSAAGGRLLGPGASFFAPNSGYPDYAALSVQISSSPLAADTPGTASFSPPPVKT